MAFTPYVTHHESANHYQYGSFCYSSQIFEIVKSITFHKFQTNILASAFLIIFLRPSPSDKNKATTLSNLMFSNVYNDNSAIYFIYLSYFELQPRWSYDNKNPISSYIQILCVWQLWLNIL